MLGVRPRLRRALRVARRARRARPPHGTARETWTAHLGAGPGGDRTPSDRGHEPARVGRREDDRRGHGRDAAEARRGAYRRRRSPRSPSRAARHGRGGRSRRRGLALSPAERAWLAYELLETSEPANEPSGPDDRLV